jgi:hypothetical protein
MFCVFQPSIQNNENDLKLFPKLKYTWNSPQTIYFYMMSMAAYFENWMTQNACARQLDKHHTIIANNWLLYLISRLSAESCVLQLIFHSPQAAGAQTRSVHFATAASYEISHQHCLFSRPRARFLSTL